MLTDRPWMDRFVCLFVHSRVKWRYRRTDGRKKNRMDYLLWCLDGNKILDHKESNLMGVYKLRPNSLDCRFLKVSFWAWLTLKMVRTDVQTVISKGRASYAVFLHIWLLWLDTHTHTHTHTEHRRSNTVRTYGRTIWLLWLDTHTDRHTEHRRSNYILTSLATLG